VAIIGLGILSAVTLPREATPEIKIPFASVVTVYPGTSPLDIEKLITEPLEKSILNLEETKMVQSYSSEGMSSIFIEFEANADISDRLDALEKLVQSIDGQLPDEVQGPRVIEMNLSNQPILTMALSSDGPHEELAGMANILQSEILDVRGVSRVDLAGVRSAQLVIELDIEKLDEKQVSIFEVINVLQSAEVSMPLGILEGNNSQHILRLSSDLNIGDIKNLIVRPSVDGPIRIADLGEINFGLEDVTRYSRVSYQGSEPANAISLNVYKRTGADVIKMVDDINERIEELRVDSLKDATIFTSVDYAKKLKI